MQRVVRTNFMLATTPSALCAGRGREYENMSSSCKSREVPRFLALEPVSFSTTAAYLLVFADWGTIRFASVYEKYLLVLSTATNMA